MAMAVVAGRGRVGAGLVLAVAVLAGCSSSTETPSASASRPTKPASAMATATPTTTATTTGLRGYPSASLRCPTGPNSLPSTPPVAIRGQVRAYVVCPVATREGTSGQPVGVLPTDGAVFAALDAALRRPDLPPVPGGACPALAQLPRTVLVETTTGAWTAYLPVDACGFYQAAVVGALNDATG